MTNVARLSSIGTCFAFEFDDNTNSSFSVSIGSTVFSNEFDENTSTTLSGNQRMSATSTGGLIVLDSINEIDPYGEISTNGLELHLDSVDSNINSQGTPQGQQVFTANGTFTVPAGVTQVSAVVVGGGGGGGDATADDEPGAGGGGGGLSYGTFTVTSGESLTVTVGAGGNNGGTGGTGGTTSIARGATTLLSGGGGSGGSSTDGVSAGGGNGGSSGGTERDGGGTGGNGGSTSDSTTGAGGGGGAAGYSGNGGAGSNRGANNATAGAGGGGGGGGGGTSSLAGGGGGGVGLLGEGTNGAAATNGTGGGGGSNGDNGTTTTNSVGGSGGLYGGGGAGGRNDNNGGDGAAGAARIIYGTGRSYPSTLTTDQSGSSLIYFWEDISGNNRDAQFKNATNNPKEGSGTEARVDFDSSNNEYAVIDGDAVGSSSYNGVTGTAARTIIVGFKLDALAINSRPFSYGTDASGERFTFRLTTLNNFRVELGNGYTETDPITTTDLHVFAVVVPAGGSPTINDIRIWDDGIEQTLTTSGGTITISTSSANNVAIGGAIHEASPTYMNGQYIKVMIYSRELTDLEIKLIYRSFLRNIVGPRT
jgi:hypothetical protein